MSRTTTVAGTSIAFVLIGAAGFLLSAVYRLLKDRPAPELTIASPAASSGRQAARRSRRAASVLGGG
ncbi:MAG TPA: hypothetical protein VIN12_09075 [Candidatus Dormibacteraeota bacterium]